jgi:hypothetical protein
MTGNPCAADRPGLTRYETPPRRACSTPSAPLPDRLARVYAYQVPILDELRFGVGVHHRRPDFAPGDPQATPVTQVQAIAEYESQDRRTVPAR